MRTAWISLAIVAGCYAPTVRADVPCPDMRCPAHQLCVTTIDGSFCFPEDQVPPDGDFDGDGVLDSQDDCPKVADPAQDNEDGDRFGDACDPCPIDPNDTPTDPDGDGVADPCDPNPTTPGDAIVLFEGFHHGIPADWTKSGTWTASNDDAVVTSAVTDSTAQLMPPDALTTHETMSTRVTLVAEAPGGNRDLGIVDDYDPSSKLGVGCAPLLDASNAPRLNLLETNTGTELATGALSFQLGDTIAIELDRNGQHYTCRAEPPSAGATTIATDYTKDHVPSHALLRVYGASAHFAWLLVVTSP